MVMQKNKNKQIVWQDIKPAQKPIKLSKKTKVIKKIKRFISIPFKLLASIKKEKKISKKTIILLVTIFIIAITLLVYLVLINNKTNTSKDNNVVKIQNLTKGTPEYSTMLPTGKNISNLGGWTRVSPSNSDPVFAYTDKISDIKIIVSQQPIPDTLKSDSTTDQVEQLAKNFNANEKITVGDTTVYIGTSSDGPQSVIFTKNNLLILIKSDSRITNNDWLNYINSLQ